MVLGKLAGVRLKVNIFFLLLCLIYCYLGLGIEVAVIFASVLIHELAHAIMAALLKVKVAEIELLPFGGQAKIEDFTGLDPDKEIYIALAGPILSFSAAAIFYFFPEFGWHRSQMIIQINFCLGIFNLLPALPLDGGRILRAFLSGFIGYKKATARSALLGKMMAVLILAYGLWVLYRSHNGAEYILIGVILYWSARREGKLLSYAFMRYLVNKKSELSGKGFLSSRQIVSFEDARIKSILDSTRPSYYTVVLILDEKHRPVGLLSEAELIECLFEKGPQARLKDC